jgi:ribosomal protein S18 acetylase RimI-like enzyme
MTGPVPATRPVSDPLENPFWYALTGEQRSFAQAAPTTSGIPLKAARYQQGVAPMGALESDTPAAWADLEALTAPGEVVAVFMPVLLDARAGWTRINQGNPLQMAQEVAASPLPAPAGFTLRPLTADDVPQMLELVKMTQPGPFQPRTIELGLYLGLWNEDAPGGPVLAAMTGQRARTHEACEVSAVCTHPDYQRRGLAKALVSQVAAQTIQSGLTPFLHVNQDNTSALATYQSLGFTRVRALWVTVLKRDAPGAQTP